jgi:hypothetical protein
MKIIDYIRNETLDLGLFCASSPLRSGAEAVDRLLQAFEALSPNLRPQQATLGRKTIPFNRTKVAKLLLPKASALKTILNLGRSERPETLFTLSFVQPGWDVEFWLRMYAPYGQFVEPAMAPGLAGSLESLVRNINQISPVVYGYCHTKGDFSLGHDPHGDDPAAKKQVYGAYWLNVFGKAMVKAIGRDRVLATPAAKVEELPSGAVMFLTRPTPEDITSDAARVAQAKALVHLLPNLAYQAVLTELEQRSKHLAPVEREWDPDLTPVFELMLDDLAFAEREAAAKRFSEMRPDEPDAWRPAADQPASDVPDPDAEVAAYSGRYAEQFVALMHRPVPDVGNFELDCLPKVDHHFWSTNYSGRFNRADIDNDLVPALGAWLGKLLVLNLGGQWRPMQDLREAAVVVGARAWLPFQHARQYLQSREAVLNYSLTKLARVAERSAKSG